ncbi:hypothetical protein UF64_07005 [Thalassospira sp. HJ]|uniref:glycosyltransferase family 2 protein n=1 Tax=Thalassospira sp. HJ TaxID=1616823 RepID=UPI0005CF3849|nr:glycosyltransferase family 2 protein [Thalassospira sp. HJ]KJE35854.1 hypothetical protein UF64_07005 [Thalassospira sp. HJ]
MKLIVQIPCYNEESSIADVLMAVPKQIDGIKTIETVVIDDGSTDGSAQVARDAGATYVLQHHQNLGLATAFTSGMKKCRELGADIVVNIDADGQYNAAEIPILIAPIREKSADLVIGNRRPDKLEHFSLSKRFMQKLGSRIVSSLSRLNIPDTTSGFRAYSREALYRLTIETNFSHSLETILQAHQKKLVVCSVPISAAHTQRQSRLAKSSYHFVCRSIVTILRVITYYRPLPLYWGLGGVLILVGSSSFLRFLWFYFVSQDGEGHIQSLVIGGSFIAIGFTTLLFGTLADQTNKNRRILEDISARLHILENHIKSKK